MITDTEHVTSGLKYWCNSWPRRVTKYQRWATGPQEAAELILDAEDSPDNWPFISVYSFPEGHTKDGKVPRIDRLFIDFDVPDTGDYRGSDRGDPTAAWIRDMSGLLVRARKVARFLLKTASPESWQVTLSGHKGIHIDMVFPPISTSNGDFSQFVNGINAYADALKEYIIEATGLDDLEDYIDVDSSDLGRMRRVPNTKHLGATEAFGEDRFCVPVTLEELAELRPAGYIELTRSRREVTSRFQAVPNKKAAEVLTQRIRTATSSSRSYSGGSTSDPARLVTYVENQNDNITVDDLPLVLSDRPSIFEWLDRDDAFDHRSASHYMEMFAITQMMDRGVPIEIETKTNSSGEVRSATVTGGTMVDSFRGLPGFDKRYTCERIETYISLGYKPMTPKKLRQKAPVFCSRDFGEFRSDARQDSYRT